MFKAPNVQNFTAKEKFEREKRKERIYERDKLESNRGFGFPANSKGF
jgi:hypothetical protein